MNIDTMLRDTLRSQADDAPPNAGLLDAALTRSRQRRRHRQLAVAGLAVAVLAAGAVATPAVVRNVSDTPPVMPAGSGVLEPASYDLAPFPFTPGWVPEHASRQALVIGEAGAVLTHTTGAAEDASGETAEPTEVILVGVLTDPEELASLLWGYDLDEAAQDEVVVQRQDALRYSNPEAVGLTWELAAGQWVAVVGLTEAGISAEEVLHYAEQLASDPMPVPEPFTFDLLPPGVSPWWVDESLMQLSPAGDAADADGSIAVTLADDNVDLDDDAEPVQAGRHHGHFVEHPDSDSSSLTLRLDDGTVLDITTYGSLRLERDDLILLAAGIEITPDAKPYRG